MTLQAAYDITEDMISQYKEVFKLFDKDEDGVLTFQELSLAMKTLGQRQTGTCAC